MSCKMHRERQQLSTSRRSQYIEADLALLLDGAWPVQMVQLMYVYTIRQLKQQHMGYDRSHSAFRLGFHGKQQLA